MLIHCTKKLAAKLPKASHTPLEDENPVGSWHANIFTADRRNCVLFIHDKTRYTLFLAGLTKPTFTQLDRLFKRLFLDSLVMLGIEKKILSQVALAMGPIQYDAATNRSVLATANITKQDALDYIYRYENVLQVNPLLISHHLNGRPVTIHKQLLFPNEAITAHLHALFR